MSRINLMIAAGIGRKGGIASVLKAYKEAGFFEAWNVRPIATHTDRQRLSGLFSLWSYSFAVVRVLFYFAFYKVGLVHIHMASRGSYLRKSLLVRLIKFLQGRVILHLHGAEFRDFYAKECSPAIQSHIRNTFEMSDLVVVLSSQWLDWVQENFQQVRDVRVVYNTVARLDFSAQDRKPGEVVFLGRVGRRKGVLDLIRAFEEVRKFCPHARLKICGDGNLEPFQREVEKLKLDSAVNFLGWISGEKKQEVLGGADIYCLPSYNEGLPMGVLEAMSAGVTVVSSNAGGIPDAITDKKNGFLIEPGDVAGLANALITLIQNRELNVKFASLSKKKFEESFSEKAVRPVIDGIYSDLLGEGA